MQILKKKYILNSIIHNNNYLDIYKYYLKDLNFINKFKNKNNTLLKDILLLKINDLYLLNINLKENYFFPIINNYNFDKKSKNTIIYFIQNHKKKMINDMVIKTEIINSFFFKFYINFLLRKLNNNKYRIIKLLFNNNKSKIYYKKKIKINLPYIKGNILKTYKKKYSLLTFCGLIFKIKLKNLYINNIKKKKIYNSYLKKRFKIKKKIKIKFKKFKKHNQYFYYFNKLEKNKLKFNFSRIFLIKDLKKNEKFKYNNLKYLKKINNLNNIKKFSFFLIK